jgi:hypothetical protein
MDHLETLSEEELVDCKLGPLWWTWDAARIEDEMTLTSSMLTVMCVHVAYTAPLCVIVLLEFHLTSLSFVLSLLASDSKFHTNTRLCYILTTINHKTAIVCQHAK